MTYLAIAFVGAVAIFSIFLASAQRDISLYKSQLHKMYKQRAELIAMLPYESRRDFIDSL